jgi:hypothetical protein
MPLRRSVRGSASRQRVFPNSTSDLRPVEQATDLLFRASVREIGVFEDLAQRSAAMVFADDVLGREFLALRTSDK